MLEMEVARRRGFCEGEWQAALSLASCQSRRRSAGSGCHEAPKQSCSTEIPPEIDKAARPRRRDRHRSLRFLQGGAQRFGCVGKANDGQMAQQSGWGFAPAVPTKRTRHATVQANAKFAEIRFRTLLRLQSLQSRTIAHQPRHLQAHTQRRSYRLARTWWGIKNNVTGLTETSSNSSDITEISSKRDEARAKPKNQCTKKRIRSKQYRGSNPSFSDLF